MTSPRSEHLKSVFGAMSSGPMGLAETVHAMSSLPAFNGSDLTVDSAIAEAEADPDSGTRTTLQARITKWDFDPPELDWTAGTQRVSSSRRSRIYELLAVSPSQAERLGALFLVAAVGAQPTVFTGERSDGPWAPWYSATAGSEPRFYWDHYSDHLRSNRNFLPESVDLLDRSTDAVMDQLGDPNSMTVRSGRVLVVGHVQSGKTANFTGLAAKAIDAGYRLIIVLAGRYDILRSQTQRRLDMELVGKEVLGKYGNSHEYSSDTGWGTLFTSYGATPKEQGSVDIVRLTQHDQEYVKLTGGRLDLLSGSDTVKMIVCKKHPAVLKRVIENLETVDLSSSSALIIDDESDDASVNTIRPPKSDAAELLVEQERRDRTATNEQIVRLLRALPRGGYVGYTATPFANVFIDVDDEEDLFPRDMVISLPPPKGYQGASAFHDLGPPPHGEGGLSNEAAFIRDISDPFGEDDEELQLALDLFLLSGAVKLYREAEGFRIDCRHHTMLAHESVRVDDHEELRDRIVGLWVAAGYDSGHADHRLEGVLEQDINPVTRARLPQSPIPANLAELKPYLGEAIGKIDLSSQSDTGPVLVVNGADIGETPNFDQEPVWKILVGGAKLSRGYTVEGLTISWFRRRATYQDTLMQMGRWFGFRPGYSDLVRLFIGRNEPHGNGTLDLYEGFGALCADEESFREQLSVFQALEGEERVSPERIPPLVWSSHPQFRPSSPNKMFNAELKSRNWGGRWIERTLATYDPRCMNHNEKLFDALLTENGLASHQYEAGEASTPGFHSVVPHDAMLSLLKKYSWSEEASFNDVLTFLGDEIAAAGHDVIDAEVDDWVVLLPQLKKGEEPSVVTWPIAGETLTCVRRGKVGERFGAYSDPGHRLIAQAIVGTSSGLSMSETVNSLSAKQRRGVMLLYLVHPKGSEPEGHPPTMGFSLLPPINSIGHELAWGVRKQGVDQVIVEK